MQRLPSLSQHFLRSPATVKRLLGHTNIKKTDTVYDLGAGSGVIASVLAGAARKVVAVEADERLAPTLRKNLQSFSNVEIKLADIMAFQLPNKPYKVFANIPFHLSSPLIRRLTAAPNPPVALYLVVQEQFARKLLPDNPGYSSQRGIITGVSFAARIRYRLRPADFSPRPAVPTVLLELIHRRAPLVEPQLQQQFSQFIEQHFTQPRHLWRLPLSKLAVSPHISPSRLTLSHWVELFRLSRSSTLIGSSQKTSK